MENQTKAMSTLVHAQQDESTNKVEGFCGKAYTDGNVSCGKSYTSGNTQSTSEELDILI
ncbi:hypothetical protein [Pedobacter antarcticus]|uniref:hypothetical protein n=1 Tax=Pedobacter antarcticus TaxID=34086 RepID=UPI0029300E94|nr:hypothetical protein [Pedobacter antarcticus]